MCDLTTEWILESAQSFSVCTYIYFLVTFYDGSGERRTTHSSELEGNQMLRTSGMLIGDPLCEGSNASSTNKELWRVENSFLRMRGNLIIERKLYIYQIARFKQSSQ